MGESKGGSEPEGKEGPVSVPTACFTLFPSHALGWEPLWVWVWWFSQSCYQWGCGRFMLNE